MVKIAFGKNDQKSLFYLIEKVFSSLLRLISFSTLVHFRHVGQTGSNSSSFDSPIVNRNFDNIKSNLVKGMSCNYAENLSPYDDKGILGTPEVNLSSLAAKLQLNFFLIHRFLNPPKSLTKKLKNLLE